MFKKRSRAILEKFESNDIILKSIGANFFGQESKGLKQVRGNGVLILTANELFFEMWIPKKELRIPIKSIMDLETTKWHLKKSKGVMLLKVNFTNEMGKSDSGAWWVQDLDFWIQKIEIIRDKKK